MAPMARRCHIMRYSGIRVNNNSTFENVEEIETFMVLIQVCGFR